MNYPQVKFENNQLIINDEVVRTISPRDKGAYKFTFDNEECYFIYEKYKVMNKQTEKISLYPIDMFKPNIIEI
jgi:hypothetical protein